MDFSIISALIVMGGLGVLLGVALALASKVFSVEKDDRVIQIEKILPGANCGACGAPGCSGFAEGVVQGKYKVTGCIPGGGDVATKIAEILGTEAGEIVPKIAVVRCRGDRENCVERAKYQGITNCTAAVLIDNGAKGCIYGCLGYGTCVEACPFNAISMQENGLPRVDEDLCTGCGECVRVCPRGILELIPKDQKIFIGCVSRDFGKKVKSVCKVGCIGCGLCAKPTITENQIITMDGHLPLIHYERIKDPVGDLKLAVEKCPTKSFVVRGSDVKVSAGIVEKEEETTK